MSGRGKRKDGEEYGSGDDAGARPSHPKKPFKSSVADDDDDNSDAVVVCELSKNKRVSVKNWQGKVWVDLREFYVKDGKTLPGKKGITMNLDQWNILRDHAEEIDKAMAESS
ncbi:RNA polymerase II transcriptional coactivator KIWI-like [Rutidosis leptorrhynchoides]|uniref:RNA polymerase II transcriptional coactivator KIWI-like n=1 Tax=Rutidosis leptorrhynchoides TaxID=125765 RepID=UPI003A99152C